MTSRVERLLDAAADDTSDELGLVLSEDAAASPDERFTSEELNRALEDAAWAAQPANVRMLLRHGAKVTSHAVIGAANRGVVDTWRAFVEHGWDPDDRVQAINQSVPPLALVSDKEECLEFLLDSGANIHAACDDGKTALDRAAQEATLGPARLLLGRGAAPGPRALIHALDGRFGNRAAMVALLLEAGADANPSRPAGDGGGGATPLHLALAVQRAADVPDLAAMLVRAGADVHARATFGGHRDVSALELAGIREWECPGLRKVLEGS